MPEPIYIFTDGACKGNPGDMGIGIVIIPDINDSSKIIQIQKYIGKGTNNIAELTAINIALEYVINLKLERPIALMSDSQYALNVLTKFNSIANKELIKEIKNKMYFYKPGIKLMYIQAHANNYFNNLADKLASEAAQNKR